MRCVTADTERAERLRAAIEAMPPGPSRTRFSELAASLGRPPATPAPPAGRLLSLDDEVLPDEDVLPAGSDEVPIGQWQTWAPSPRRLADQPDDASPDEEAGDDDAEEEAAQTRPPLRIPASRPTPANEITPPPKRQRRWRRHRSP